MPNFCFSNAFLVASAMVSLGAVSAGAANWNPPANVPGPFALTADQKALVANYLGEFDCTSTFFAIPQLGIALHEGKAFAKADFDLSGMWMHLRYVEFKTSSNPQPYSFEEFWTFTKDSTKYGTIDRGFMGSYGDHGKSVSLNADDFEASHSIGFEGTLMINPLGAILNVRDTGAVTGCGFEFNGEVQLPADSSWVPQYKISCKKR